jgi:asparagine synthase (glutamine-hydrolysing)
MCGVVGIVGSNPALGDLGEAIARMGATVTSRGPDGHGAFVRPPEVALGHRRLAIIDRSGGAQPMTMLEERVALVYNGEVYNHRELRKELEAAGCGFRTRSDTEVVLNAYLKFGADCPRRLRGMFAFAIWDARDRSLLLVRDRLGIKPMFFAERGGAVVFGSEIKALLASGIVDRTLDAQALDDYFAYGFIRSPRSIYTGVRSLLPGQSLRIQLGGSAPKLGFAQYWQLPKPSAGTPAFDWEEAKLELERLITESVELRLLSEVPLGALLSGGIDSSTVVWAMARAQSRPVKTFSIGFAESAYDETPYARAVARHFGAEHHEERVAPSAISILPELVRNFDEPFADPSAIPTWYVHKMVRQHVTVCLSGDGGDELFAGYARYRTVEAEWKAASSLKHRWLSKLGHVRTREGRARNRAERLSMPDFDRYYARFRNNYSPEMRSRLFSAELQRRIDTALTQDLFQRVAPDEQAHAVSNAQLADLQGYLSDDILVKLDRTSMAHSVEARVPLLDHVLLGFVQSLPLEYKLRRGEAKALLVDLIRPHLPAGVLDRKKQGFSVPLSRWFRNELRERLREAVEGPTFANAGLFDAKYVRRLYELHQSKRVDLSFQLWQLLVFDEWWRAQSASASGRA